MNEKKLQALRNRKRKQAERDKAIVDLTKAVQDLHKRVDSFEKSETKVTVEKSEASVDVSVDTAPVAEIVRQFKTDTVGVLKGFVEVAEKLAEQAKATTVQSDDIYARYSFADSAIDSQGTHIGYVDAEGNWFIQRVVGSNDANSSRFAVGKKDYGKAWSRRQTLNYKLRSEVYIP